MRRYRAIQPVISQVQLHQVGQVANLLGDAAAEVVVGQIQHLQAGQFQH